jgi:hypothetical protein
LNGVQAGTDTSFTDNITRNNSIRYLLLFANSY